MKWTVKLQAYGLQQSVRWEERRESCCRRLSFFSCLRPRQWTKLFDTTPWIYRWSHKHLFLIARRLLPASDRHRLESAIGSKYEFKTRQFKQFTRRKRWRKSFARACWITVWFEGVPGRHQGIVSVLWLMSEEFNRHTPVWGTLDLT